MMHLFVSLIGILITILLVVGVHEFGHFIVAKSVGIKVLRFSIGFGKTLFRWHDKQGTEYVFAAIPLGGYVKMLDEHEAPINPAERHLAYNQQPYLKKFAVIAAGPLFNLIFAFLIYWFLFVVGFVTLAPIVGDIKPNSIAAQAGMQAQQEIIAVDHQSTLSWTNIIIKMLARSGDQGRLIVEAKDLDTHTYKTYTLDLAEWKMDDLKPDILESLGITPYEPSIPAIIGTLKSDSPAVKSRLLIGDKITEVAGKPITDWPSFTQAIQHHPHETLIFTVLRQGKTLKLPVTLGQQKSYFSDPKAYLGVAPAFEWPSQLLRTNKYGVIDSLGHAASEVKLFTQLNFIVLGKMLSGKMSVKSLGGPISIFEGAGQALNQGFVAFMIFLAFLSISIGILNILPIPGLDGGHLVLNTIESLSKRPLSQRTQVLFYRFGLVLILLIMTQALVNDISRLV